MKIFPRFYLYWFFSSSKNITSYSTVSVMTSDRFGEMHALSMTVIIKTFSTNSEIKFRFVNRFINPQERGKLRKNKMQFDKRTCEPMYKIIGYHSTTEMSQWTEQRVRPSWTSSFGTSCQNFSFSQLLFLTNIRF